MSAKSNDDPYQCFICGKPAKEAYRYLRQVESTTHDGILLTDWRPATGWRLVCKNHAPLSYPPILKPGLRHQYFFFQTIMRGRKRQDKK